MLQIPVSAGGFDSKLVFWCLLAVHIYTISSGAEFQKADSCTSVKRMVLHFISSSSYRLTSCCLQEKVAVSPGALEQLIFLSKVEPGALRKHAKECHQI